MTNTVGTPNVATVLAVTSGKCGVGKTNVTVNVALSLARLGYRVGLIDADFGLGNVDVMLGLTPENHLGHLLAGEKTLAEIVIRGPLGVEVIPASSGLQSITSMSSAQRTVLRDALHAFASRLDFLLIDTAAGISDNVVETLRLAERVAIVTSLEPSAVVDAYATAKILTHTSPQTEIGVIVNSVRDGHEAGLAFRQLDIAASRFLGRSLRYYGFVAEDRAVRDSVLAQRAVVDHLPQAAASRCFRILASRLAGLGRGPGGLRLAVGASSGRRLHGGVSVRVKTSAPDMDVRDRLVIEHVPLVKTLAQRLAQRLPSQVEMNDLISVGVLGLIDAATRYRPSLGVPFDAFARRRVDGAMLDALRELDWAPRSLRRLRREMDAAVASLRHRLGREPREEEIADAMDLSVPGIREGARTASNPGSRLGPSARRTHAGRHTAHRAVHRRVGRRRNATRAQGTQAPSRTRDRGIAGTRAADSRPLLPGRADAGGDR